MSPVAVAGDVYLKVALGRALISMSLFWAHLFLK